tara:strand:+ start:212 stop:385 length:174 start_codon:yes stop_codon:yes gene_type:complete
MRVGTLVNHENYFGIGIVIDIKKSETTSDQIRVHWLKEGKDFGWSWIDDRSVEIICK